MTLGVLSYLWITPHVQLTFIKRTEKYKMSSPDVISLMFFTVTFVTL